MITKRSSGGIVAELVVKVYDPRTGIIDYAYRDSNGEIAWKDDSFNGQNGIIREAEQLLDDVRDASMKSSLWEYKPVPQEPYIGDY